MAAPPIQIAGVNHWFGRDQLRKQILFDVTTDVPAGEIVIVTGPSGSGKTTLLTLVGALRSTQEGSMRVLGAELSGASSGVLEDVRRQIGFIFQQHNLVKALTALQNVELGLRVTRKLRRGALRKRAIEMLEAVGLGERVNYYPEQLSGGQRQRVAIARALAAEPPMLLADEPTASLDKQSGREVVERMKVLAKQNGTTILLVTHDNRILDVADRIIHLEDGRLSTFTDAVIANNRNMMGLLAQIRQKEPIKDRIAALDELGFRDMLQEITDESQRFLEATEMARDQAFRSMLEQGLFGFTCRLGQLLNAERASLFTVDDATRTLVLRVAEDLPEEGEVRIPLGSGIAGSVAQSGTAIRIDDAYADSRFNPAVDHQSGFRTRSILALPIKDQDGHVFAVAQLLNRRDGQPFDDGDERRFATFVKLFGVILETLQRLDTHSTRESGPVAAGDAET
jgi:putative ABC transport system ATP-binding protein